MLYDTPCLMHWPEAKWVSTLKMVKKIENQIFSGLCPSFIPCERKEKKSHTCLWFQHVRHGDTPVHPHSRHVAIWEGLQQKCRFQEWPMAAWGAEGELCGLLDLPVWVANLHGHFRDVSP